MTTDPVTRAAKALWEAISIRKERYVPFERLDDPGPTIDELKQLAQAVLDAAYPQQPARDTGVCANCGSEPELQWVCEQCGNRAAYPQLPGRRSG